MSDYSDYEDEDGLEEQDVDDDNDGDSKDDDVCS